ncbi:MAG: serine hydrolase [Myxococcota bacterium]|nr:serine hydrolase [Myxococcota bacterium]
MELRIIKHLGLLCSLLLPMMATAQNQIVEDGLTDIQTDALIAKMSKQGYRLRCITGYSTLNGSRYALRLVKSKGPKRTVKLNLSPQAFSREHEIMTKKGARLVRLDGHGAAGKTILSAVWQRRAPQVEVQFDLPRSDFLQADETMRSKGMRLIHVDGYRVDGAPRFLGLWTKQKGDYRLAVHLQKPQLEDKHRSLSADGYRLVRLSAYQTTLKPRFVALWHLDPSSTPVRMLAMVDAQHIDDVQSNLHYSGYQIQQLDGRLNPRTGIFTLLAVKGGGLPQDQLTLIDQQVEAFKTQFQVPGLSLAFSLNGKIVFAKGYGYANPVLKWPMSPTHPFRLAGLSKVITAIATFKLLEMFPGRINLNTRIFGPGGLLNRRYDETPLPADVQGITIGHLLRHNSGGWSRGHRCSQNADCGSKACREYEGVLQCDREDPMPHHLAFDRDQLIQWALSERPLQAKPGTLYRHSHFGYALLGRIIETVTDGTYDAFVRAQLLEPAGVPAVKLGEGTDAAPNRRAVRYSGGSPYSIRMRRIDATQGWLGSVVDVLTLFNHADGQPNPPDIISAKSVSTMKRRVPPNKEFGAGWYVEQSGFAWHDGAMDGSRTLAVQGVDGLNWVILTNVGPGDDAFGAAMMKLGDAIKKRVPKWPPLPAP